MESLNEVFQLLSKERRRYALYHLEQADGPVHISELADQLARWENEESDDDIPHDKYEGIVLTLRHSHLPQAAKTEYIEYDPESNFVEISGSPAEFRAILHVAEAIEHPGHQDVTGLE